MITERDRDNLPLLCGTKFECYRMGGRIYKVSKCTYGNNIDKAVKTLYEESQLLKQYLGHHVVPSDITPFSSDYGYKIVISQPYIDGISLQDAIRNQNNVPNMVPFLQKAISMYELTGKMPDIAGRPHISGWYDVATTPNVVVSQSEGIPYLVDTELARLSTFSLTKDVHNRLLMLGTKNLLIRLKVNATDIKASQF